MLKTFRTSAVISCCAKSLVHGYVRLMRQSRSRLPICALFKIRNPPPGGGDASTVTSNISRLRAHLGQRLVRDRAALGEFLGFALRLRFGLVVAQKFIEFVPRLVERFARLFDRIALDHAGDAL